MNHRIIAEQIFLAGIESVLPDRLILKEMALKNNCLFIAYKNFSLEEFDNIYIIGAGKGSAKMASAVENVLGNLITKGHIVVKYGYSCILKFINVSEAGHPVPDSNGYKAAEAILEIARMAGRKDLVICLLSGGGSALLPDFPEGSSIEDMIVMNNLLINSGACIKEINAVRKHLSVIKGGQIAGAVYPATLINLVLSDVPGDDLDVIASGPTAPDPTTFQQAVSVLKRFNLIQSVPSGILNYLLEGEKGNKPETPKTGDPVFEKTHNILIGTNRVALEAAKMKALEFNINALIIDYQLHGDILSVAEYIVETALRYQSDKNEVKPVSLLFGGETTIRMTGEGLGGRNQHLALLAAKLLQNHNGITVLSAGSDGTDGPTDAAGAVVDSDTVPDAMLKNIDPEIYLKTFDSYHFFKKAGGHIITGPTMTNVMDIIVVIID